MAKTVVRKRPGRASSSRFRVAARWFLSVIAALLFVFYASTITCLIALRSLNPPTTSVHIERRIESWFSPDPYTKRYSFVPLNRISLDFQHAVIAAEDARFFQHHGFDWKQVEVAAAEGIEGKRSRGASTIDQQLIKNLFLTTSRSVFRKGIEATLVPVAELILGKRRILELYLNVVEWGPGVYGAEAASRFHYRIPAVAVNREQGARLAALLPSPRSRRPAAMTSYADRVLGRMRQVGW